MPAGLGRPTWVAPCPSLARFSSSTIISLCDLCARVLHLLHRPNALVHSFACIIGPSTWCSCFESCPCSLASLASHATMNFLQSYACCPPMLVLCMWSWWKLLRGHPIIHYGVCKITLTRLPPSKHVLSLSTPLISKIKNNFRAMGALKHKFREIFKPLKTNVSRKYVPTTFILVENMFPVWSWGHRF
jgi:hypothetical protein